MDPNRVDAAGGHLAGQHPRCHRPRGERQSLLCGWGFSHEVKFGEWGEVEDEILLPVLFFLRIPSCAVSNRHPCTKMPVQAGGSRNLTLGVQFFFHPSHEQDHSWSAAGSWRQLRAMAHRRNGGASCARSSSHRPPQLLAHRLLLPRGRTQSRRRRDGGALLARRKSPPRRP